MQTIDFTDPNNPMAGMMKGMMKQTLFSAPVDVERGIPLVWGLPGFDDVWVDDAVYASCALPGFFPPGQVQGRVCVDGGVVDNLPVAFPPVLGVDAIIAVEVMVVKIEQGWDRVRAATFAYTSTAFPMLTGTLVTVAGSGIGRAVALALYQDGWTLVLAGRRENLLKETAQACEGKRTLVIPTDLRDPKSIQNLFKLTWDTFGRLDLLFNNAGVNAPAKPMEELNLDEWKNVMDTNLTGAFRCAKRA